MKMFYLFSLFVNWKMKMLNIEKSSTTSLDRKQDGYTHTHTALEFNVIVLLQEDWHHQALHLPDAV